MNVQATRDPLRRSGTLGRLAVLFSVALATVPIPQTAAQSVVRAGESRANQIQYFSSHNSYQRADSISEQLDKLNVWEIELDVRWANNAFCGGNPQGFYVYHSCADDRGEGWLSGYLDEIAGTKRIATGFVFLNIEDADVLSASDLACLGCGNVYPAVFPPNYRRLLEDEIVSRIGRSSIYTWTEFVNDARQWPSVQELIRRGKHVVVSLGSPPKDETFFFGRFGGTAANVTDPIVILNNSSIQPGWPPSGDRLMTRRYLPGDFTPPQWYSCDFEKTSETIEAITKGVNFPATNCLGDTYKDYMSYSQPPLPLYVSRANASQSAGRGTFLDPVVGPSPAAALKHAISLVAAFEAKTGKRSLIELSIPAGDYDLTAGGGSHTIGAGVKLTSGGIVTLR